MMMMMMMMMMKVMKRHSFNKLINSNNNKLAI